LLALLALMECIQKPNSIVKLLTDTKLHVKTIFEPIFREILEDCPEDVKPNYSNQIISTSFLMEANTNGRTDAVMLRDCADKIYINSSR